MSEWWTYSLSDFLLFSPRTYYRLFELYNAEIWPMQVAGAVFGAAILILLLQGGGWQGRAVAAMLAGCWLFVAWAYLLHRYETINWAASYFALGFALEALLLIWSGTIRMRLRFAMRAELAVGAGLGLLLFALLAFPLIGVVLGRPWLQVELFGVAPDPTAVATLGVLLAAGRMHWELAAIPLAWCAISGATLWAMHSPDAPVVPAAAALALILGCQKTWSRRRNVSPDCL